MPPAPVTYRASWRFVFEGLEGVLVALAVLLSWPVTKRWLGSWGATPDEVAAVWPGDTLVSEEHVTFTRGVTIDASADHVWPWLVQFGLGRAAFYSYELLERLVGIPVRNVESVVPEFQTLSPGDEILLHPKAPGIPVAAVEPLQHICFGVADKTRREAQDIDPARSWSMYIVPLDDGRSRLVLRSCVEALRKPTPAKRLSMAFDAPIDFIMEQRMLRTIRRLAEEMR